MIRNYVCSPFNDQQLLLMADFVSELVSIKENTLELSMWAWFVFVISYRPRDSRCLYMFMLIFALITYIFTNPIHYVNAR